MSIWTTKEDILQDLNMIGQGSNIEGYLIKGQGPPPPRRDLEDDDLEMDLRFGGPVANDGFDCHKQKPDLNGISTFLRMVNDEEDSNKIKTSNDGIRIITKSKIKSILDPTVKEFVPKTSKDIVSDKIDMQCNDKTEEIKVVNVVKKPIPLEVTDITAKLRDKISDTSRANTPQLKKERNVALANLLKLHSFDPVATTTKAEKKLVLLTPDYYKRNAKEASISPITSSEKTELKKSRNDNPQPGPSIDTFMEESIKNSATIDPDIEESIKKVNQWFEQPNARPNPAPPVVCLAPVSFRKKGNSNSSSPPKTAKPIKTENFQKNANYKPSGYANELKRQYEEKMKIKEVQSGDMWTRLEAELKARDKKFLEKQKAASPH